MVVGENGQHSAKTGGIQRKQVVVGKKQMAVGENRWHLVKTGGSWATTGGRLVKMGGIQ